MAEKVFPYKGLSEERLAAAMNVQAGSSLVYGVDFVFDTVQRELGPDGRNTIVRVVPTDPDLGYSWHRYTRLWMGALGELTGTAKVDGVYIFDLQPGQVISTHGILNEINLQLGLDLTINEVQDMEYTLDENASPIWMELKISNSVAWLPGSSYTFGLNQQPEGVGL